MLLLNKTILSQLPNQPGVYLLYSDPGQYPIYIGKSINIQQRIKSHYQQAKRDSREEKLMNQAHYIDWQITAGEIGALILESILIKEKLPLKNQRLRKTKKIYSYQLIERNQQLQLNLIYQSPEHFKMQTQTYGLFRNQRTAQQLIEKLILKNQLCKKIAGLEKTSRSCFAYQLKRCKGACIGEETLSDHNQRLLTLLQQHQHQAWPYPTMIGLIEQNPVTGYREIHCIQDWCYLGKKEYLQNTAIDLSLLELSQQFDLDIYKIILWALTQPAKKFEMIDLNLLLK